MKATWARHKPKDSFRKKNRRAEAEKRKAPENCVAAPRSDQLGWVHMPSTLQQHESREVEQSARLQQKRMRKACTRTLSEGYGDVPWASGRPSTSYSLAAEPHTHARICTSRDCTCRTENHCKANGGSCQIARKCPP